MKPNPGSPEAIKLGCTCPILDNGGGKLNLKDKDGNNIFWYNANCPLHCKEVEK